MKKKFKLYWTNRIKTNNKHAWRIHILPQLHIARTNYKDVDATWLIFQWLFWGVELRYGT